MQWLAASSLTVGLLLALYNWSTLFPRSDGRNHSPAPLVGGILLATGLLGFPELRPYTWTAIVIDPGTWGLIPTFVHLLFDRSGKDTHSDRTQGDPSADEPPTKAAP